MRIFLSFSLWACVSLVNLYLKLNFRMLGTLSTKTEPLSFAIQITTIKDAPSPAHTYSYSLSFLIDMPLWHWFYTSSRLTLELSSLSSEPHILSGVFLVPRQRAQAWLAYKGWFRSILSQQLPLTKEPQISVTQGALALIVFDMKNMFHLSHEKGAERISIIIDKLCSSCWIVDSPFWQNASKQHVSWSAPLWSLLALHSA